MLPEDIRTKILKLSASGQKSNVIANKLGLKQHTERNIIKPSYVKQNVKRGRPEKKTQ